MTAGERRIETKAATETRKPNVAATETEAEPSKKVRIRRPAAPVVHETPPQFRYDTPHPPQATYAEPAYDPLPRFHPPHASGAAPPHFDVHTAIATKTEARGGGAQIIGQILAYSGVLALTVGTALVIWSYFGGPADYAPTGWLITTGGQMLLFLGVVTLVAGGLEQTSRDVRVRIESLGERLIRIEHAATNHALKGPHSPVGQYAGQPVQSHQRAGARS